MKIFFQTIFILFLSHLSFAQTNYYVSPAGSDANDGSQANPWATIEYAINSVSNPSVGQIIINISNGVYNLLNNQIDINRSFSNLTLLGEGSDNTFIQSAADTLSSTSRVIRIYSGNNVLLKNLTVRYGRFISAPSSRDGGGGILNDGGTLTIDYCKITENSGFLSDYGIGGGISNIGGNLTIKNSTISNNTGGKGFFDGVSLVGAQGGGIGSVNGTLYVYNSTISYNYAPLTGGGICVISDNTGIVSTVFNMLNSTVYGNSAKLYGGVRITIFLNGNDVITNINSCTIFNNSASDVYGGLGLSIQSSFTIKNSIVAGNTPSNLTGSVPVVITSGGYNIIQSISSNVTIDGDQNNGIGVDPLLLPLAYNNSTNGTYTCAIQATSPAKDAIPTPYNGAPLKDQRGYQRFWNYDVGAYEYTPPFATVNAKVFLEGPYNGTGMDTTLNTSSYLPTYQPYGGSSWNYAGSESVTAGFFTTHTNIVDWVLVELRSTYNGTSLGRRAAFLKSDGTIVDTTGLSPVLFNGLAEGNYYYIVIRHRNHLDVMSKDSVSLSSSSSLYDFTTAQDQAYGTNPMKALSGGGFGMIAGDTNFDEFIDGSDFVGPDNEMFNSGYLNSDANLDGFIDGSDFINTDNNMFSQSNVPN